MFARSFPVVLGLVIIASIATANDFPKALRILQSDFGWAKLNCLYQAVNTCQDYWKDRERLLICGGKSLQVNIKGQCTLD